ncbi:MAG: cobyric acid synthase [Gammaproteobacteria bacterium]|nr:cobyric acid synthase [Gammaproteobacteria bacterium]
MRARALMLQGTGSDVGKSVIVAALCRIALRRGLRVAPFKPQNMSNNAAACAGGEIGRAQALQAQAAGLAPQVDFNPVLLKPESDRGAQVIVHGKPRHKLRAADFTSRRGALMDDVLASFNRLAESFELIIVEGAGSPAEINLRQGDIANMGFARRAGVPVVLIGDIDRGGVIASVVGTQAVLDRADAELIRGFVVNKFRGDPKLFDAGMAAIESRTGWRGFGLIPWLPCAAKLPAEDAVVLERGHSEKGGKLRIAAPMLSRIANFDDADPLRMEPAVDFTWLRPGQALPPDADVIILFGTKSTAAELDFLRAQGWDRGILAHARSGGRVLGLCGGFQLLGRAIDDPDGIDGPPAQTTGLGLLEVATEMRAAKTVDTVAAHCALTGLPATGYEIHAGHTRGADCARPMFTIDGRAEGARSADGLIEGSYLHGVFANDGFRREWLRRCGAQDIRRDAGFDYRATVERALDELADGVETALDIDALLACAARPASEKSPLA